MNDTIEIFAFRIHDYSFFQYMFSPFTTLLIMILLISKSLITQTRKITYDTNYEKRAVMANCSNQTLQLYI